VRTGWLLRPPAPPLSSRSSQRGILNAAPREEAVPEDLARRVDPVDRAVEGVRPVECERDRAVLLAAVRGLVDRPEAGAFPAGLLPGDLGLEGLGGIRSYQLTVNSCQLRTETSGVNSGQNGP